MTTTRRNFLHKAAGAAAAIPFAYAAIEKHLVKTLGVPEKAKFMTVRAGDWTVRWKSPNAEQSVWNANLYGIDAWIETNEEKR